MFEKSFLSSLSNLISKGPGVTVVGVCGLGGSGKSTLCKQALDKLGDKVTIFEIDWFASPSTQRRDTVLRLLAENNTSELRFWEQPVNWYDWNAIISSLSTLVKSRKLSISNAWDQTTGICNKEVNLEIGSIPHVVIVEGIYLLHSTIRSLLDSVFMLDIDIETTIERAELRDSHKHPKEYLEFKKRIRHNFDKNYFIRYKNEVDYFLKIEPEAQ